MCDPLYTYQIQSSAFEYPSKARQKQNLILWILLQIQTLACRPLLSKTETFPITNTNVELTGVDGTSGGLLIEKNMFD